jgi:hypothetical protein
MPGAASGASATTCQITGKTSVYADIDEDAPPTEIPVYLRDDARVPIMG